jgi:hypothetical protein
MKTSALLFIAAIAAAPSAALAQASPPPDQTQTPTVAQAHLDLVGVAPDACVISAPSLASSFNVTVEPVAGPNTTRVTVNQMINTETLQSVPASVYLNFPLICSGPNRVILTSARGGMRLDGSARPAPGFTDRVDYVLNAQWAGRSATGGTTTGGGLEIDSPEGANGLLYLSIKIGGGQDRLFAGTYSDTLTLDVQPAT